MLRNYDYSDVKRRQQELLREAELRRLVALAKRSEQVSGDADRAFCASASSGPARPQENATGQRPRRTSSSHARTPRPPRGVRASARRAQMRRQPSWFVAH